MSEVDTGEIVIKHVEALEQLDITEDCSLEAKKAAGKTGQGELPRSFFESYSAMANTGGGLILLGVEETAKGFKVSGIKNVSAVKKQLWDGLNNSQTASANLLTDDMVTLKTLSGRSILIIQVPRARREQRPVYVFGNPKTGTFRRNHEGDYRCDEATVKRMLAEQMEPSRDSKLMSNFGLDDIDMTTFNAYRQALRATKPDHPWLAHDDLEFLRCLGGWTKNRETGETGLSLAGLLMFGKLPSILEGVPNYIVDYRERIDAKDNRWIDRVTTDGS